MFMCEHKSWAESSIWISFFSSALEFVKKRRKLRVEFLLWERQSIEWPLISKFNKTPTDDYGYRKWVPNCILDAFVRQSPRNLQFRYDFPKKVLNGELFAHSHSVTMSLMLLDFVARLCDTKLNLLLSTRSGSGLSLEVRMRSLVSGAQPFGDLHPLI